MLLPFIGIIVSLVFLIGMAYRGHSVIAMAPLAALIALIFSGEPLLASYTQVFMPAVGRFITNLFPLFLAGAIFGRLMTVSGYATDIAQWIPKLFKKPNVLAVVTLVTALLTYGGVSVWVVVFTVAPIARALFREAGVSFRLMPAAVALGAGTFAATAMPGSPQILNVIPTRYFETTTFAASLLGFIGSTVVFGFGVAWLTYRAKKLGPEVEIADAVEAKDNKVTQISGEGPTISTVLEKASERTGSLTKRGLIALLPIALVIGINFLFVYVIGPRLDTSYLAEDRFGGTSLQSVIGVWSVTLGLFVAGLLIFALRPSKAKEYLGTLTDGATNAVLPSFTTASEVGYGAVIDSLAVFAVIRDGLFGVSENPIIVGIIAAAGIAGITGSGSGGISITLEAFGDQLYQLAQVSGTSPDLLHRVIAMASVSFDSLPHNGAIITMLLVCGITHRQGYKDIAVVTIGGTLLGLLTVVFLGLLFPFLV